MRIESFKLTRLETFLIAITIAGIWLAGTKNNWTWLFAFLGNFIWFYIGFTRKIAIVIITTILIFICNLRGFYLWVILGM